MATKIDHGKLWALIRRQHWTVTRVQLLAFGVTDAGIKHRLRAGRLHRVFAGVYAVGRQELTREGLFMAAVLAAGEGAALSHDSAAELWGLRPRQRGPIEVTAPGRVRRAGIVVHQRAAVETTHRKRIPVTTIAQTFVDLAPRLPRNRLERALNEADLLGLTDPERLRAAIETRGREAAPLKRLLDRRTFRLTRSDLERHLIPIALKAGLPMPETRAIVNGYEVDFWWPELGLIVESDGSKYHRTPATLTADRLRDQVHTAAGLTVLRFTDEQIAFEEPHVERTLRAVQGRLATSTSARPSTASGGGAEKAA